MSDMKISDRRAEYVEAIQTANIVSVDLSRAQRWCSGFDEWSRRHRERAVIALSCGWEVEFFEGAWVFGGEHDLSGRIFPGDTKRFDLAVEKAWRDDAEARRQERYRERRAEREEKRQREQMTDAQLEQARSEALADACQKIRAAGMPLSFTVLDEIMDGQAAREVRYVADTGGRP